MYLIAGSLIGVRMKRMQVTLAYVVPWNHGETLTLRWEGVWWSIEPIFLFFSKNCAVSVDGCDARKHCVCQSYRIFWICSVLWARGHFKLEIGYIICLLLFPWFAGTVCLSVTNRDLQQLIKNRLALALQVLRQWIISISLCYLRLSETQKAIESLYSILFDTPEAGGVKPWNFKSIHYIEFH